MKRLQVAAAALVAAASPLLSEQPITFFGIGPLRVGMKPPVASEALGAPLVLTEPKEWAGSSCYHLHISGDTSLQFMFEDGRVARVETEDPRFRTASGVRVGDTEAVVHRIYATRLEVQHHKYIPSGHYLIVRSADHHYALVMETDGQQVVGMRAGVEPSVEYVEGCE